MMLGGLQMCCKFGKGLGTTDMMDSYKLFHKYFFIEGFTNDVPTEQQIHSKLLCFFTNLIKKQKRYKYIEELVCNNP